MPEDLLANLEQDMKELIAKVSGRDVEELKPDAHFWEDLGIDSIKAIEITVAIEKKYKIRVKDEQIPEITTVAKAIEVVREALQNK
ncbi:MAG: acyl carrier protein [Candidatus Omnitrophica bacterium]|nr:acyl carrier protein [Candidatus Omnitrophota bacterium]MBU1925558.1 acyl carrier protein [Candidatus Omnitrophota bacterium]